MSQLSAEEGQAVARGTVLAHIEAPAMRDAVLSARSGVRSAEMALELAKRNYERAERLAEAGAIADRDLETAPLHVTNAEAMLADAQARLASAEQQLSYTDGAGPVRGHRERAAGPPGAMWCSRVPCCCTVVDPAILRLEATVPVEQLPRSKVGAPVEFSVAASAPGGSPDGSTGSIPPSIRPPGRSGSTPAFRTPGAAGGRALRGGAGGHARAAQALVVPSPPSIPRGTRPGVMALRQGKVVLVPVELGLRDEAGRRWSSSAAWSGATPCCSAPPRRSPREPRSRVTKVGED